MPHLVEELSVLSAPALVVHAPGVRQVVELLHYHSQSSVSAPRHLLMHCSSLTHRLVCSRLTRISQGKPRLNQATEQTAAAMSIQRICTSNGRHTGDCCPVRCRINTSHSVPFQSSVLNKVYGMTHRVVFYSDEPAGGLRLRLDGQALLHDAHPAVHHLHSRRQAGRARLR